MITLVPETEKSLRSKARPAHEADNLTATCEPMLRQSGILNISQPCRPPLPVNGDSFTFYM
jgi:hypothetical protein